METIKQLWFFIKNAADLFKRLKSLEEKCTDLENRIIVLEKYRISKIKCSNCGSPNIYVSPEEYTKERGVEQKATFGHVYNYRYWTCEDCNNKMPQHINAKTLTYDDVV